MKLHFYLAFFGLLAVTARASGLPLVVDASHSRVEIVVKATVDSFTGKLDRYEAILEIDPSAPAPVTRARVAFKFADVKTGNADRDEQMLAWGANKTYPDGVYTLASLTKSPDGGYTAVGTLVFHGMSREISFPVAISRDGEVYAVDGDAMLDTREFGLPIFRKFMLLKVDPEVHVRFHIQGSAGSAAKPN